MINFRVSNFSSAAADAVATAAGRPVVATNKLSNALSQTNQFLEGNSVVNRHTSVMFSRELLVFYVDRRSYAFNTNTVMTNMARLPTAIAGFERINNIEIELEEKIYFNNESVTTAAPKDTFTLKSFVVADVNNNITGDKADNGNYVIGSSAYINATDKVWYKYAPADAIKDTQRRVYNAASPGAGGIAPEQIWDKAAKSRGVIFIYVNENYGEKVFDF
jgi:hypothetical protein